MIESKSRDTTKILIDIDRYQSDHDLFLKNDSSSLIHLNLEIVQQLQVVGGESSKGIIASATALNISNLVKLPWS